LPTLLEKNIGGRFALLLSLYRLLSLFAEEGTGRAWSLDLHVSYLFLVFFVLFPWTVIRRTRTHS